MSCCVHALYLLGGGQFLTGWTFATEPVHCHSFLVPKGGGGGGGGEGKGGERKRKGGSREDGRREKDRRIGRRRRREGRRKKRQEINTSYHTYSLCVCKLHNRLLG